ncbi:MAG: Rrf2 family transcriptional regulator [Deltaproteobacteria bacterium]|nr:Rrf2 family transcriptional regulator [Deltaproteobacteria bacterium]
MVITRATEYAIRALLYLARQPKGQIVYKKDICKSEDVTPAFLTKILQPLIKNGIVGSQRGVGGGFYLLLDPSQITLLDVVQSQEGLLALNHCLTADENCGRQEFCPVRKVWEEANRSLTDILAGYDLFWLAQQGPGGPGARPKSGSSG